MSVHRDAYRLEQDHLEIPEHLQYRPYTVPNPYAGVHPRYLDQKHKKYPTPFKPESDVDRIHGNVKPFKNVQPRYLDPKHKVMPQPVPNIYEKDLCLHDTLRKQMGWGGVHPRYLDNVVPDHGKHESPKDKIERQRKEQSRVLSWKGSSTLGKSYTFDELRQRNKKYLRGKVDHSDVKPAMRKPSVIAEYIRHGTPIKHHTTAERYVSPRRDKEMNDVNPTEWIPGGGCGGGRWFSRSNSPVKTSLSRVDERVRNWREHAQEMRVGRDSVPRVAHLSPAESYSRSESPSRYGETQQDNRTPRELHFHMNHHDGNTPQQQQPQQTQRQRVGYRIEHHNDNNYDNSSSNPNAVSPEDSHGEGEPEVLVGPVTVAVPPGAVVRLNRTPGGR